jgi:hypothetical protein
VLLSASEVADTLKLLVPGFVLLKLFYWFALRTKRSDSEWVIWSVLASVPIGLITSRIAPSASSDQRLGVAMAVAVVSGGVVVALFHLAVQEIPDLRHIAAIRVWDRVLERGGRYIEVRTKGGELLLGWPGEVASSLDTDDLDLYLRAPVAISADGRSQQLRGVEGVLLSRSDLAYAIVFEPTESRDPAATASTK